MLIVQKFGGTSVAGIQRVKASCEIVKKSLMLGKKVVVVVSAMAGETDKLISAFKEITMGAKEDEILLAEMDSIISTGEQFCAGIFASFLNVIGVKARSFTGFQAGILTDGNYTNAQIEALGLEEIKRSMDEGFTPVITGFQGFCLETGRQTTFGRGGSDTSAIAIAAALSADKCEIYKDVEGVFTGDPTIVLNPKKQIDLDYNSMLEIASSGAKVLELRSVNFASKYNIKTEVLSSFSEKSGTIISANGKVTASKINENAVIYNISYSEKEVFAEIETSNLLKTLKELDESRIYTQVISFENNRLKFLLKNEDVLKLSGAKIENNIAKISIIGVFLKNGDVLEKSLEILEQIKIVPFFISISETKVVFIIPSLKGKEFYSKLHEFWV